MQILFQFSLVFASPCPKAVISQEHSVKSEALNEISGIGHHENRIIVHNDSGDASKIYVMNVTGDLVRTLQLENVVARDWEDMSIAPFRDENHIFIGDVGDNLERHKAIFVHAIPVDAKPPYSPYTWKLSYGDHGPQDAEGIAVDPVDGRLYVLTKGRSGTIELFNTPPLTLGEATVPLELVAQFPVSERKKPLPPLMATALDISPDGQSLIMRNYLKAFLWQRELNQSWQDVLSSQPCIVRLPRQPQGESLGFVTNDELITISERPNQPIYRIRLKR